MNKIFKSQLLFSDTSLRFEHMAFFNINSGRKIRFSNRKWCIVSVTSRSKNWDLQTKSDVFFYKSEARPNVTIEACNRCIEKQQVSSHAPLEISAWKIDRSDNCDCVDNARIIWPPPLVNFLCIPILFFLSFSPSYIIPSFTHVVRRMQSGASSIPGVYKWTLNNLYISPRRWQRTTTCARYAATRHPLRIFIASPISSHASIGETQRAAFRFVRLLLRLAADRAPNPSRNRRNDRFSRICICARRSSPYWRPEKWFIKIK